MKARSFYYIHPLLAGPLARWETHLERARDLGFEAVITAPLTAPGRSGDIFIVADHDRLNPALGDGALQPAIAHLVKACSRYGLSLYLDLVLDAVADDGRLAAELPGCFSRSSPLSDPRSYEDWGIARARFGEAGSRGMLEAWWSERLVSQAEAGVAGYRCLGVERVPAQTWRHVVQSVRAARQDICFFAWTPGLPWETVRGLAGAGFDALFSSAAWWDARASWLVEEHQVRSDIAPSIGFPEEPFGRRLASTAGGDIARAARRALRVAAATSAGLLVPMGFEFASRRQLDPIRSQPHDLEAARREGHDLSKDIAAANALLKNTWALAPNDGLHALTGPEAQVTAILRTEGRDARRAQRATLVVINPDLSHSVGFDPATLSPLPAAFGPFIDVEHGKPLSQGRQLILEAGDTRLFAGSAAKPIVPKRTIAAEEAVGASRIAIENISPTVDGGRFAVKRLVGQDVVVEADILIDGHDKLAAELLWRPADETEWRRVPMRLVANDRWRANFPLERLGRHVFTLEAWRDAYASWRDEIEKKRAAALPLGLELREGREILRRAAKGTTTAARRLDQIIADAEQADDETCLAMLFAAETARLAAEADPRPFLVRHSVENPILAERSGAGFASWYELFPRSQTDRADRHGRFADVIARLPAIREMGFDVLYFPPIHPIGRTNRKGKNNSLTAGPNEPGSPYAIGAAEGGHDAIHPELGSREDFRQLVAAAAEHGIEIALDFAIQCSPDHPWLKEHPGWFAWRADGTLRYAENPPKKYEDIVNVDFYAPDAVPSLWTALRDVVLHWVGEGVKLFRVDNPHTKPLPFWEWLIADVTNRHPDVLFLSEAFTRPKMMYRLAKVGFSQSYTYFTWRNDKRELTEYLEELSKTQVREFFRPHFFVNTPDINPFFLHNSGRPGFLIRAALAATLSGLWGVYSGFELCEAAPVPGKEEYLDSEKYEIKPRDWGAPGNIIAEIERLNRIRRSNPALQSHLGVTFHEAFDDAVLFYEKATPNRDNVVLVAVTLDPTRRRDFGFALPLWTWGLSDDGELAVEDLMRERSFVLAGKHQHMSLDPADLPFAVWRVRPLRRA